MSNKRKNFPSTRKQDFLIWAQQRGYLIGDSKSGYEAFRLLNHKKGEILIGHHEIMNEKVITTTGRLSQLVAQWEKEIL